MKLDAAKSRVAVYTFAEGLLSALAHDLEIVAADVSGSADANGDAAEVRVAIASLKVSGVMKKGRLDKGVLSDADRATIEKQIREDVLPGAEIVARGARETGSGGSASVEVAGPRGQARVSCKVNVASEPGGGAATRVSGSAEVSLKSLGAPPVKGPMGAFRVSDKVRVDFDLVFS
jgi:hypothetical protein